MVFFFFFFPEILYWIIEELNLKMAKCKVLFMHVCIILCPKHF